MTRKRLKAENSEATIIAAEAANVTARITRRLRFFSVPVQSLALMLKSDAKNESGDFSACQLVFMADQVEELTKMTVTTVNTVSV